MKRIFLILAFLFVLILIGLALFLATFNADRYRPLLVSRLQAALGHPVRIERLSLAWRGGLAVALQGLAVEEDARATGEPLIQMESASAVVRLAPLLRKEVRIASVILTRPRVRVARDAQGRINLLGLAALASPAAPAGQPQQLAGEGAVSFNPAIAPRPLAVGDMVMPPPMGGRDVAPHGAGVLVPRALPVGLHVGAVRIEAGTIHWSDAMAASPAELWLKALDVTVTHITSGQPMEVSARGAFAAERQNLQFNGRVTPPSVGQPGTVEHLHFTLERVPIESLLPPSNPGAPQLRGLLTVKLEGGVATLEAARLARSVSGEGQLQLAEPVVINLNVLRAVFEKFSMIPGLVERLQSRLPPEYQAKLSARDTTFEPITLSAHCEDGVLHVADVRLRTDTFGLAGSGTVGLDGSVDINSRLRIEPALSAALVRSVSELQALVDAEGAMQIPVAIQGRAPQISVVPDLRYVASKVIITKVADVLGELLQRRQPVDGAAPPDQPQSTEEDLLGQFLKKALKK